MKIRGDSLNLNHLKNYRLTQKNLQETMKQLSTGKRINSAKNDSAGLSVSTRLSSQVRGTEKALQNVKDGLSIVQTKESVLSSITDQLQRMRELAVQLQNGTNSTKDNQLIRSEMDVIKKASTT